MSERLFLFVVGAFILISLYIEIDMNIYILCLWLLFEAIMDIRLTTLSQKLMSRTVPAGLTVFQTQARFDFEALRALRIMRVMVVDRCIRFISLTFNGSAMIPW